MNKDNKEVPPDIIYMQLCYGEPDTWASEQIGPDDVVYVRADHVGEVVDGLLSGQGWLKDLTENKESK